MSLNKTTSQSWLQTLWPVLYILSQIYKLLQKMPFGQFFENLFTDAEVKVLEFLHKNIRSEVFLGCPWPVSVNPAKAGKKSLF